MVKVCVDGFNLALPRGTGIATYGRNLLTTLQRLGHSPQVLFGPAGPVGKDNLINTISISDPPIAKGRYSKATRWAKTVGSRLGRTPQLVAANDDVIWNETSNPRPSGTALWASQQLYHYALRSHRMYRAFTPVRFSGEDQPSVMHWTCPLPLWSPKRVNIYTFHDLIPLTFPSATSEDRTLYLSLCKEVARRADHIFSVSETTRQSAIRVLGIDENKITTTYQSVALPPSALEMSDKETGDYIGSVFDLDWKGYFLFYGAIEPKKNLTRIIEAYLSSGVSSKLIIVGGRSWLDSGEGQMISNVIEGENIKRKGRIIKFDYMSADMLTKLVRGAKATLFPSLYEGFGLPVLESMLLGTAVITSTAGSLPEVAGDAALIVDPYDVDAISRAIAEIDADDDLRRLWEIRGLSRARMFSPDIHASKVSQIYKRLGISMPGLSAEP